MDKILDYHAFLRFILRLHHASRTRDEKYLDKQYKYGIIYVEH